LFERGWLTFSFLVKQPWEKQDQESLTWDLISPSSVSGDLKSEVQHDSNKAMESADSSNQGVSLLQAEVAAGSESPTDDAASLK
jgi:hypothetical protein